MKVPGWIATPTPSAQAGGTDRADVGSGVEGNTRLSSATGMVLLALLAVEGVTILSVRQMITLHVVIGVLLLGPVLLKTGSTIYRFTRYYTGSASYRAKGPPHPLLRAIGPFVILSSLALLGTGVALIVSGTTRAGGLLTAHQAAFWIWVGLMTVHVLGHLWEAAMTSWNEIRESLTGRAARHRRWRLTAIAVALIVGVGAVTALLPAAAPWTNRPVAAVNHTR